MNTTITPHLGNVESTQDDSSAPGGTNAGSDGGGMHDFTRKRELMQRNIDNILRGNVGTMSQKVVMDRNYYNMFYKYQDSNAKLLKIRQQTRTNQTSQNLHALTAVPVGQGSHTQDSKFMYQYRTLSKDSSKGSRAAQLQDQSL